MQSLTTFAAAGDLFGVETLLAAGAPVDAIDNGRFNETPLMAAARAGHGEIVMLLLAEGADVNHTDNDFFSPVTVAARAGKWNVVVILAEYGGDFTVADGYGKSGLDYLRGCRNRRWLDVILVALHEYQPSLTIPTQWKESVMKKTASKKAATKKTATKKATSKKVVPQKSPATIDDYLAALPADQQAALEKLRQQIQAAAPQAAEGFSYGIPAFLIGGKAIAGFSASAKHCSFFPMSGHTVAAFANDLAGFETSKGTIRFTVEKPLPAALVKKIVKARVKELGEGR